MTKKNTTEGATDWVALKSGSLQNGIWFATHYPTGWFFVSANQTTLGPYTTFQDGLKEWTKVYGKKKK
jgi:hypothetical protein